MTSSAGKKSRAEKKGQMGNLKEPLAEKIYQTPVFGGSCFGIHGNFGHFEVLPV